MKNRYPYISFGEGRSWQSSGQNALDAALDMAHLTYGDIESKLSFLV